MNFARVFRSRPPNEHWASPAQNGGEPLCHLAALSGGSKRLTGKAQGNVFAQRRCSERLVQCPLIGLLRAGPFARAVCCQLTDLPNDKAAPLRFAQATRSLVPHCIGEGVLFSPLKGPGLSGALAAARVSSLRSDGRPGAETLCRVAGLSVGSRRLPSKPQWIFHE